LRRIKDNGHERGEKAQKIFGNFNETRSRTEGKEKACLEKKQAFQKNPPRANGVPSCLFLRTSLGQIVNSGRFIFPNSTLFQKIHAFKTLQNIPFNDNFARAPKAFVL
jgi:hypothetical protein